MTRRRDVLSKTQTSGKGRRTRGGIQLSVAKDLLSHAHIMKRPKIPRGEGLESF